jgi:hypothetical protein
MCRPEPDWPRKGAPDRRGPLPEVAIRIGMPKRAIARSDRFRATQVVLPGAFEHEHTVVRSQRLLVHYDKTMPSRATPNWRASATV